MAYRATPTAVRDLLGTELGCSDPTPFIRTANALTNWLVTQDEDSEISDELLVQIELYLAAHFLSHKEKQLQSKNTGKAGGTFAGQTGQGLAATMYGTTAMDLDPTNRLSRRNAEAIDGMRRVAKSQWLGTPADSPRPDDPTLQDSIG